jgi:hypothetical protein
MAQEDDPLFLTKFLHFLDVVFNTFCHDLADYHTRSNPIRAARDKLEGRMERDIESVVKDLRHGLVPNLQAPVVLTSGGNEGRDKDPKGPGKGKGKGRAEGEEHPEWWTKNPKPTGAWCPPAGKQFHEFLNSKTEQGRMNMALFPQLKHHNPKVTGLKGVCFKYAVGERCRPNCFLSHVVAERIDSADRAKLDAAFKKVYL